MVYNNIYRIIDANINRASEALRVIEDYSRFAKDNLVTSEKLKKIRHEINYLFSNFQNLIFNRDSVFDVGRSIENTSKRTTVRDVIKINCKRAQEALRTLSEYGQLLNINISKLEESRYEIYTLEKGLLISEKLLRLQNALLYLVTNRDNFQTDKEFFKAIEKSIEGKVDIIQLREKKGKEKKIIELAQEIKKMILGTEILFIVNDRLDIALSTDADGVHLGQDDLGVCEARKICPEGFLIGLSTHSVEQGKAAISSGADYLGIGPVFPTPTKPDYKASGLEYVTWASENIRNVPWFAIGGIDESNIDKVICAGAKRVAVVRAIMNSSNPLQTTIFLKQKLQDNTKVLCTSQIKKRY